MRSILVTGGAGYIGTHVLALLQDPADTVVVLDDMSSGSRADLARAEKIAGRRLTHTCVGDLASEHAMHMLNMLFHRYKFTCVLHLAARKSIGACGDDPLGYYHTNVTGLLNLLGAMAENDCKTLVFSSSAAVYAPSAGACAEDSPVGATNCYARTKLMCEDILRDVCAADPAWRVLSLRYFNPAGAHPSGLLRGGAADALVPALCAAARGHVPFLVVFGTDYPESKDGTPVRDLVHVVDIAEAHVAALAAPGCAPGFDVVNLGAGTGVTVLEAITAMEHAACATIPWQSGPRRDGDLAVVYANTDKAARVLGWRATRDLDTLCRDAWNAPASGGE